LAADADAEAWEAGIYCIIVAVEDDPPLAMELLCALPIYWFWLLALLFAEDWPSSTFDSSLLSLFCSVCCGCEPPRGC
jgi:hypothetical protein